MVSKMKSLFPLRMVQGEGSESHEDTPFLGRGMFTSSSLNTPEIPAERTPASIEDLYIGASSNLREGKRDDKETKIFKNLYKGKNKTLE